MPYFGNLPSTLPPKCPFSDGVMDTTKGCEEDKQKRRNASPGSAAEQEHRKRVLRDLNSLISGGPAGSSPDDVVEEERTPGQAFFSGVPRGSPEATGLQWRPASARGRRRCWGSRALFAFRGRRRSGLRSTEVISHSPEMINQVKFLFNPSAMDTSLADPGCRRSRSRRRQIRDNDPSALWITDPSSFIED
ncbi:hypothetical protein HPP92_001373 [Vanilla planifolia]|uniref:Uncharacterized protein n=1 Tax=Vanilla planifolia TaxID=51239 RepID=A0A835S7K3_VANPL|nr:hypothetical protein HPP92_001373 [Vanilla planifolia]